VSWLCVRDAMGDVVVWRRGDVVTLWVAMFCLRGPALVMRVETRSRQSHRHRHRRKQRHWHWHCKGAPKHQKPRSKNSPHAGHPRLPPLHQSQVPIRRAACARAWPASSGLVSAVIATWQHCPPASAAVCLPAPRRGIDACSFHHTSPQSWQPHHNTQPHLFTTRTHTRSHFRQRQRHALAAPPKYP
jgi:hypothetical protein